MEKLIDMYEYAIIPKCYKSFQSYKEEHPFPGLADELLFKSKDDAEAFFFKSCAKFQEDYKIIPL